MRLYRIGDHGEPVRDIQDRLHTLGFPSGDSAGEFGNGTDGAVKLFQGARGLAVDGIVGPNTWQTLVAAGYTLGDRMLYHRVPMMRGDDAAELQRRLNSLGFDAGKVDGIFGPDTLAAVLDFQSNRGMPEDGIAGREVARELDLMVRATDKPGRHMVRERQWLATLPHHMSAQRVYVDAACRDPKESEAAWRSALVFSSIIQDLGAQPILSRTADTEPTERVRALRANRLGVDFIVSFAGVRDGEPGVFYFASAHSASSAGAALASVVAAVLGVASAGMSIPMLKDTRAPAVVIMMRDLDERIGGATAQGVINFFADERSRLS